MRACVSHIPPMNAKLMKYPRNSGHCSTSADRRRSDATGTVSSRASRVMAMAKTPSEKALKRSSGRSSVHPDLALSPAC